MPRQIIIENSDSAGRVQLGEGKPARFDARDAVLLFGGFLVLLGVWLIHHPSALILGGILCLLYSFLGERAKARESKHGNPDS